MSLIVHEASFIDNHSYQDRLSDIIQRPTLIHSSQFDDPDGDTCNFQCNCACADDGFTLTARRPTIDSTTPLIQPFHHRQQLTDEQTLVFNPFFDQGISVLNRPAFDIWQRFQQPQSLADLCGNQQAHAYEPTILEMLRHGALQPVGMQVEPQRGDSRVLSAWLHVTNECNLRCDYCYINKTDDDMSEATGRAAVDAILRSARIHGFRDIKLKFAGGEATLNLKRVFDIHDYALTEARSQGMKLESVVLSNGVAIGERAIEAFMARGIRVSISLDGIGTTHDVQRQFKNGRGSFAWVDRTLERLLLKGIKPFISITLSNRNAAGLAETVRYVTQRNLPFNINFFRDNDCAATYDDLQFQEAQIVQAMEETFTILEENPPQHSLLGTLVDRAQFNTPHDRTCGVGDSYIVVDHRGQIAKCQMEIERPITNVFAEDPLNELRLDRKGIQNLSVDEKEGCRTCEWKYWCAGGCPVLTYRATGRYDVKSPNCGIYKALYPRVLRLEGLRLLRLATGRTSSLVH